jgi:diadenosine tetraphosphate (Ap4A) HIT family hydrolase
MPDPNAIPRFLLEEVRRLEELWGLPELADSVTVDFSRRFRSSLGRCRPVFALWDAFPVNAGHALIIPYRHVGS